MVRPQAEMRPTVSSGGGWDPRQAGKFLLLGLFLLWVGWRAWAVWRATQTANLGPTIASSNPPAPTTGDAEEPPLVGTAADSGRKSPGPAGEEHSQSRQEPGDRPALAGGQGGPRTADRPRLAPPGKSPGTPPRPGLDRDRVPRNGPSTTRPTPEPKAPPAVEAGGESQMVRVRRVVDGDTLLLKDGTRVRMIGIDTPETKKEGTPVQPFGPEASEYTKKFCAGGTVRLVFDGERHDDYGRLLAHVYVEDRFLSEELIRNGLARVLYRHPYSDAMKDRFRAAENAAKREKKGIWSLPPEKRRGGESPPGPGIDF